MNPNVPFSEIPGDNGEPGRVPMTVSPIVVDSVVVASAQATQGDEVGIVFAFASGAVTFPPIMLAIDDAQLDHVARLVRDAVASAKRIRARRNKPAREVRCPCCNTRLFGHVAARGGCLACFPELPPDDAVDLGSNS